MSNPPTHIKDVGDLLAALSRFDPGTPIRIASDPAERLVAMVVQAPDEYHADAVYIVDGGVVMPLPPDFYRAVESAR